MKVRQLLTYLWIWGLFIPVPIINGIIREIVYRPFIGETSSNRISTVILSTVFFLYTYFLIKNNVTDESYGNLLLIGVFWVVLTIIFEFAFGYYVDNVSWQKLIDNYNIFKGNWWSLFLLFELVSPSVVKIICSK